MIDVIINIERRTGGDKVDYDKILTYLIGVATVINLLTSSAKNISDMKDKQRKSDAQPLRRNVANNMKKGGRPPNFL